MRARCLTVTDLQQVTQPCKECCLLSSMYKYRLQLDCAHEAIWRSQQLGLLARQGCWEEAPAQALIIDLYNTRWLHQALEQVDATVMQLNLRTTCTQ